MTVPVSTDDFILQNGHEYVFTLRLKSGSYRKDGTNKVPTLKLHKGAGTDFSELTYLSSKTITNETYYICKKTGDGGRYALFVEINGNIKENKSVFDLIIEDKKLGSTLFSVETKAGTTPSITALPNTAYVCVYSSGISTLSFTPSATGICSVRFTSGSSVPVLTIPSTVMWLNGFDPTSLETNKVYELNIMDGTYGVAACWDLEEAVENS